MKTCVDREDGRGCSKILSQSYFSVEASELDVCEALEFGVPKVITTPLSFMELIQEEKSQL